MTRDQAIQIARREALNSREGHGYLPVTDADAQTWMPHEWVIAAIMWAAGFKTSIPFAHAARIALATQKDYPREELDMDDVGTLALFVLALGGSDRPDDGERFRWLTEDHADAETRAKCRELLGRMGVMSYSSACADIDAAMAADIKRSMLRTFDARKALEA